MYSTIQPNENSSTDFLSQLPSELIGGHIMTNLALADVLSFSRTSHKMASFWSENQLWRWMLKRDFDIDGSVLTST